VQPGCSRMTEFVPPKNPDWTRKCKGSDLRHLVGLPYMLRESESEDTPWRMVETTHQGMFRDPETGARFDYTTVKLYEDGERVIDDSDDIEAGFIRPPDWPADRVPPEWSRRAR
jgi:hypothetical protein